MTHYERILRVLHDHKWHGGPDEFGVSFHTLSQRVGELKKKGHPIESRRRKGKLWHEYRIMNVTSMMDGPHRR